MSTMFAPQTRPDLLTLLHEQHRLYTNELGRTHQALSKTYKKLARSECKLAHWEKQKLTRAQKKKLQWSRSVTKTAVSKLEEQQADLYHLLQQCVSLISSYYGGTYNIPMIPETTHVPPTHYGFSSYTPFLLPPTPWVAGLHQPGSPEAYMARPLQCWGLSMLRERCEVSPAAGSADPRYHEPSFLYGQSFGVSEVSTTDHMFTQGMLSASVSSAATASSTTRSRRCSSCLEKHSLSEASDVNPATQIGAGKQSDGGSQVS